MMVNKLNAISMFLFFIAYTIVIALSRYLVVGAEVGPPLFWPAAGLLFAAFFITKPSSWWIYAVLGLLGNILGNWVSGIPIEPMRFLVWPFRMIIMFAGVSLLRYACRSYSEDAPQRSLFFVLIGGILTPAVSGVLSGIWSAIEGGPAFSEAFRIHFVGSSLGILTVTPFIFALHRLYRDNRLVLNGKEILLNLGILAVVFVINLHIFVFDFWPRTIHFELLVMPIVIVLSFRGDSMLTASSNIMIAGFAFYRVIDENAFLFTGRGEHNELHNVQFFVGIITLTHLLLTAAVRRRIEIMRALGEKSREVSLVNHELSRLNVELEGARREAMAASEAKSYFLANMSHEIRSPLSAMIGYAELIARSDENAEEKSNYGSIVSRNGHHLLDILNQILDLSKIEAGQFEVHPETVRMRGLIQDISELMGQRARDKGLGFDVRWLGEVPDSVTTDPLRLRQILINGLGNAIKFTEVGRIELRVSCPRQRNGRTRILCEIEDTGIGLDAEEQAKLFQAFQQANGSISRKYGGTGLGLELSRRLARLMDGDYRLKSSVKGQGSIFVLELDGGEPLEVSETPPDFVRVSSVPLVQSIVPRLKGVNVLLVDDAADNRFLITRFLQLSGATVDSAENGKRALEKIEEESFDVILMDIEMPEMNGLEATRRLRAKHYKGPVLALTGRAMPEEIEECLEAGFDGHLVKPIDREVLVQSIARLAKPAVAKPRRRRAPTVNDSSLMSD